MGFLQQNSEFRSNAYELGGDALGVQFLAAAVNQPRARRVEALNAGKIEDRPLRAAGLGDERLGTLFEFQRKRRASSGRRAAA